MEAMAPTFFITFAVVQTIVFLLLIRFLDLYEREPISVLALLTLWGMIGATSLSAVGNQAVQGLLPEDIDLVFGAAISAPLVEELAKGAALVAVLIVATYAYRRFGLLQFEGVTDGIVYGAAVGLGFAFTEDILYLLQGAAEQGLEYGFVDYLSRRDFFGVSMLHHAIYTSCFGVGLGLATWSRSLKARVAFPLLGLLLAMVLHAANNGLVQLALVVRHGFDAAQLSLSGIEVGETEQTRQMAAQAVQALDYAIIAAFGIAITLWLRYQRRVIATELQEEAQTGLISSIECELLPSYWRRSRWYWELVRTRQWERLRLLKRLHNELVEFAFLKRRLKRDPNGPAEIQRARQLLAKLKDQKIVFLAGSERSAPTKAHRGILAAALGRADFRYLVGGFASSVIAEWLFTLALVVFAYNRTQSLAWAAAAMVTRLLPVLSAPWMARLLGARSNPRNVMIASSSLAGLAMVVLVWIVSRDASVPVAIAVGLVGATAAALARATFGELSPRVLSESELAAGGAVRTLVDNASHSLGPLCAASLLVFGSAELAFAVAAAAFVVGALMATRVGGPTSLARPALLDEVRRRDGLTGSWRAGAPLMLSLALLAAAFVYGAALVWLVEVARQVPGAGVADYAWLVTALGVGGLVAAAAGGWAAASPAAFTAIPALVAAVSMVLLTRSGSLAVTFPLVTLNGAGLMLLQIATGGILRRSLRGGLTAGVLDRLVLVASVVGAAATPLLVEVVGLRTTLVALAVGLGALTVVALPAARALGKRVATQTRNLAPRVELLSTLGIFEGAAPESLEALAGALEERSFRAGETVFREGDIPRDFFVVRSGEVEVLSTKENSAAAVRVNLLAGGDYFGEIGLLEGMPRTATIRAVTDCVIYKIRGGDFLSALNQASAISGSLLHGVVGRLARTHPTYRPASATKS